MPISDHLLLYWMYKLSIRVSFIKIPACVNSGQKPSASSCSCAGLMYSIPCFLNLKIVDCVGGPNHWASLWMRIRWRSHTLSRQTAIFFMLHTGDPAYLLVANRYYIRNLSLTINPTTNQSDQTLVSKNMTNAVGLDYDWREQTMYWTDVTGDHHDISRTALSGRGPHKVTHH